MPANTKLRAARQAAGLTQFELAESCGMTEIQVSRYETGRQVPSDEHKRRLAHWLTLPRSKTGMADKVKRLFGDS